jgi:hypothetical protein
MKNISDFNSFVQTINEAAPWDPKKAQAAIDEIMKRYKENKDAEPTGLSFANVQKIYGKTDYATRFRIAQSLLLAGKNLFPVNQYGKDQSANDNYRKTSDYTWTYYIGDKDQNLKMDKFSEALLKAVKPIVDDYAKEDNLTNGESMEYIKKTALEKPVVKQAKVAIDKIPG